MTPFRHFQQRLKERYGLNINAEQYLDLIAKGCETLDLMPGEPVRKVMIRIDGRMVYAIKQKKGNKFLLTCLTPKR